MTAIMWQTTDLDYAVAEDVFGWRWYSFIGIPIKGTPGYPNECRVRQQLSPKQMSGKGWKKWVSEYKAEPATGSEPLSYTYCSSGCTVWIPHYSGHRDAASDMESEIERRGLFASYMDFLSKVTNCDPETPEGRAGIHKAIPEDRCMAALLAVGSKYVRLESSEIPDDQ